MTILDELERLHKAASVYSFHKLGGDDAEWVQFIQSCQTNVPKLIAVVRAAQSIVKAHYTDATCKDCTGETNHVEQLLESLERLDKLEQVSNG